VSTYIYSTWSNRSKNSPSLLFGAWAPSVLSRGTEPCCIQACLAGEAGAHTHTSPFAPRGHNTSLSVLPHPGYEQQAKSKYHNSRHCFCCSSIFVLALEATIMPPKGGGSRINRFLLHACNSPPLRWSNTLLGWNFGIDLFSFLQIIHLHIFLDLCLGDSCHSRFSCEPSLDPAGWEGWRQEIILLKLRRLRWSCWL